MKAIMLRLIGTVLLSLLLVCTTVANDYVPGEMPDHPILFKGGTVYTISNGILVNHDVLINNGLIEAVGEELTPPENCEIIELHGCNLYPGLISASSNIGLVEIGAIRATNDTREIGRINPNVKAKVAYNPDSEIIPSVRANGVTNALVIPGGSLIRGQSSLMNLDGWTYEECSIKDPVGMHISWPRASISTGWWETRSVEEQKKDMAENRRRLEESFADARIYYNAVKAGRPVIPDSRWEAMIPIFDGELPLFIHAGDYRQIEQAVAFTKQLGLKMVLVGGTDAWQMTDLLVENSIPVIIEGTQKSSPRQDDPPELSYQIPALLEKAGVEFCIAARGASGTRNLNLQAAEAIPYGLSPEMAIRSITLAPAEILGVADRLGSIEVGKQATLVVSEGDILDLLSAKVTMMFIDGRPVDLDNKHKELFRKYSARKKN